MGMTNFDQLLIGGGGGAPSPDKRFEGPSPATLELVGTTPEGGEADIDAAVAAARRAFDHGPWPTTAPVDRAKVIARFNELLTERLPEFKTVLTEEMGAPGAT